MKSKIYILSLHLPSAANRWNKNPRSWDLEKTFLISPFSRNPLFKGQDSPLLMFLAAGEGRASEGLSPSLHLAAQQPALRWITVQMPSCYCCLCMFVIVNKILMFSLSLVNRQSWPCRRQLGLPRSPMITCVSSIAWWVHPPALGVLLVDWVGLQKAPFKLRCFADGRSLAVKGN